MCIRDSDKTDQPVGIHRLGSVIRLSCMCGGLAFHRAGAGGNSAGGDAQIYAAGRRDRSLYHGDGDKKYGKSGAGKGSHAHCGSTAGGGLRDRAFRHVRDGKTAVFSEKTSGYGGGRGGNYYFQMGKIVFQWFFTGQSREIPCN